MLISVGERISNALCAMAIHDLGHEAISLTGSQAGIVTDTVHGKAKIAEIRDAADQRGARPGEHRPRRRLPGRLRRLARRDDARPRRLEPHRRRARGGARRARVRDVHRRRGRLHRRPAHRPGRAQARRAHVRGDARALGERREGAAATLGRVRAQPRRAAPRPLDVLRRRRNVDRGRGGSGAREGNHLRCGPHRLRAALPRARHRRRAAVRAARRRERQRRHDPPGQLRRDRLQRAARRPRRVRGGARLALGVDWSMRDDLGKVASSAPG